MNQYPLSLTIQTNIRELELMYWMRPFTVDVLSKRYRLNPPYSSLYIQRAVPYNIKKEMRPEDAKMLSFVVTDSNLYGVQEMFAKVDTWFTPESIKELYGVNDDGRLMFNMEYRELKATVVDEFASVKTAMKIVPAPLEVAQGKMEPGVVLFINRQENAIVLRRDQILRLSRFIQNFNFIAYDQYVMTCFQYALANGCIVTEREMNAIAADQAKANSNFKKY